MYNALVVLTAKSLNIQLNEGFALFKCTVSKEAECYMQENYTAFVYDEIICFQANVESEADALDSLEGFLLKYHKTILGFNNAEAIKASQEIYAMPKTSLLSITSQYFTTA